MVILRTDRFLQETDFNALHRRISASLRIPAKDFRQLKSRNTEYDDPRGWQVVKPRAGAQTALTHLPLTIEGCPPLTVNDAYEKWHHAKEDERASIVPVVYQAVLRYATAVLCDAFGSYDLELAHEVARDVVLRLSQFLGRSKFSTYVYKVINNKVAEKKRTIGRYKKHFVPQADYESVLEKYLTLGSEAETELLRRDLIKGLSVKEQRLFELLTENRSPAEIAQSFHIGKKAAESRIRRLQAKVERKLKATEGSRQLIRRK